MMALHRSRGEMDITTGFEPVIGGSNPSGSTDKLFMNIPQDWRLNGKGDSLFREFNFKTFPQGIAFVNKVAELAQAAEHHPNISISYTKVSLSVSTHSAGKVTDKDIDLALKINGLPL